MPFSPIPEILSELRAGRMVILTDDENRENEGDLILPAEFITPEAITFMLQNALGYMCLSLTEQDCDRLNLHPQSTSNTSQRGTAFTVSIDLHPKFGGTTGVSAKERAACIRKAIDPTLTADDFVRPGHINPLRARNGGVLVRTGQTEGSVDLCRLAGLTPAAVIIEVMKPDGEMARVPDLEKFAAQHKLKMCSVEQIIEYRLARESLVRRVLPARTGGNASQQLRTPWGTFDVFLFESAVDPLPHLVLTMGGIGLSTSDLGFAEHPVSNSAAGGANSTPDEPTLVRMHRRNLLGDVFHDLSQGPTPSAETLNNSLKMIAAAGRGALVYLRTNQSADLENSVGGAVDLEALLQSSRVLRASNGGADLHSAAGSEHAVNAIPMAQREFGIGGQILRNLGLRKLRLITNQTRELPGLDAFGLEIVERVPVGG